MHWQLTSAGDEASQNKSLIYGLQEAIDRMQRIEPRECISAFIDPLSASGSLVVVASNMTSQQNEGVSLLDGWVSAWEQWPNSAEWICRAYQSGDPYEWRYCSAEWTKTFPDPWVIPVIDEGWITTARLAVDYCLVGGQSSNEGRCGLHVSLFIMVLVCVCTFLGALLVLAVERRHSRESKDKTPGFNRSLVTLGDTIHSFLEEPNATTTATATATDTSNHGTATASKFGRYELRKIKAEPRSVRWLRSTSTLTWILSGFL